MFSYLMDKLVLGSRMCYSCYASLMSLHGDDDSLALLKVDMKNAFNECNRHIFVLDDFPGISAWVKWCYSQPAELCFGKNRLLASSGVQKGNPLGPLLFFLVILQFIDAVQLCDLMELNLWYLDDGMFVGNQSSYILFSRTLFQEDQS